MPEPGSEDDLDPKKGISDDGTFPSGKKIEDVLPPDEQELIRPGEFERSKPMSDRARMSVEELEQAKKNRPRVCKFRGTYYMVNPVDWTYEQLPKDYREDAKGDGGPMTGKWNRAFRQPEWRFKKSEKDYRKSWWAKRRTLRQKYGRGQRWNNGKLIHLAKLQGSPFTRERFGDKYFGKAPWTNHPNEIAIQAPVFVPTADQWYYGEKVMRLKPNRPHPHKRRIPPNGPYMSSSRLLTKVRPARFFHTLNPW